MCDSSLLRGSLGKLPQSTAIKTQSPLGSAPWPEISSPSLYLSLPLPLLSLSLFRSFCHEALFFSFVYICFVLSFPIFSLQMFSLRWRTSQLLLCVLPSSSWIHITQLTQILCLDLNSPIYFSTYIKVSCAFHRSGSKHKIWVTVDDSDSPHHFSFSFFPGTFHKYLSKYKLPKYIPENIRSFVSKF